MKLYRTLIAAVISLLAFTATASAQTGPCPSSTAQVVINATPWVCIQVVAAEYNSSDVSRIDLLLFGPSIVNTATDAPSSTVNLGKPAINSDSAVWVQVPVINTIPLSQVWKARAVTAGPTLVSPRSPESNFFTRATPPPQALTAPSATRVVP